MQESPVERKRKRENGRIQRKEMYEKKGRPSQCCISTAYIL
jgi:hypothetical protein